MVWFRCNERKSEGSEDKIGSKLLLIWQMLFFSVSELGGGVAAWRDADAPESHALTIFLKASRLVGAEEQRIIS